MSKTFVPHTIARSRLHGAGMFATRGIPCGQIIGAFEGRWHLLPMGEIEPDYPMGLNPRFCIDFVRFDDDTALVLHLPEPDGIDLMNHSETPNCAVAGLAVYAAREIESGEELTIDYNTLDFTELVFH